MKQAINLVENIEGELLVSHRVIAEQTNNKEKSVLDLITRNLAELEEFGMVRFKIVAIKNAKNRVNEEKTYYLNEPQTTLLLTFLRNNEVVKKFKVRLVTEFFKMRNLLQNSSFPNLKKLEERAKLLEISRQEYKIFEDVFFRLGITRPEELAITCNRAVKKETEVDFLEISEKRGVSTLENFITVTELCETVRTGEFSDFVQNKSVSSEKTVYHLCWKEEVLKELF